MIYITGSGRSGSSWFAELVSKNEGVPYFNEPFIVNKNHDPFGLLTKKLVKPPAFPSREYIMDCVSKAVKLIPDFVVKDFWGLYYTREFNERFGFKIINIIRNPAAWFCSASKINVSIGFYDFIGNPTVMEAVRPYIDYIYSRNDFNWVAWMSWCIRYMTLRNSNIGSWVTHEELCLDPESAFKRIGLELNDTGRKYLNKQNREDKKTYSRMRTTKDEPFKYFGKFIKLEEMKKAMEPFGVLDWDYWNWDKRFCLKNIKS